MIHSTSSDCVSRSLWRRAVCIASIFVVAASTSVATAQPVGDKQAAEALFRDGRELMEHDQIAAACDKFEKSLALYQSASAGLNLAKCYSKLGRLAAALTTLNRAAELNKRTEDPARRAELSKLEEELRREIEPRVPHVRVLVSPDVSGTIVQRDGIEVPTPLLGAPLPVDPGTYEIRVAAPGYEEVVQRSTVIEGQTVVLDVKLTRISDAVPTKGPTPTRDVPSEKPVLWPWIVGGGGLASLGVGIGFAVDFAAVHGEIDDACPDGHCEGLSVDDAEALTSRWDRDVALMATLGGVGLGLAVTGVVGLVVARPKTGARASFGVVPIVAEDLGGAVFWSSF